MFALAACGGDARPGHGADAPVAADARKNDGGSSAIDGSATDAGELANYASGTWDGDPFSLTHTRLIFWDQVPVLCMANWPVADNDMCDGQQSILLRLPFGYDLQPLEARLAPNGLLQWGDRVRTIEDPSTLTLATFDPEAGTASGWLSITFAGEVLTGTFSVP